MEASSEGAEWPQLALPRRRSFRRYSSYATQRAFLRPLLCTVEPTYLPSSISHCPPPRPVGSVLGQWLLLAAFLGCGLKLRAGLTMLAGYLIGFTWLDLSSTTHRASLSAGLPYLTENHVCGQNYNVYSAADCPLSCTDPTAMPPPACNCHQFSLFWRHREP